MSKGQKRIAVMSNLRINYFLPLAITLFYLVAILNIPVFVKSLAVNIDSMSECHLTIQTYVRISPTSHKVMQNIVFFFRLNTAVFVSTLCLWLHCLLLIISGDIHPNPGPSASASSSSLESHSYSSLDMSNFLKSSHNLSLVHYNVQSLLHKLDLLAAELTPFDIITFSETWLSDSINNDQLFIPGFCLPVRRDRTQNAHGGVAVYVKDGIHLTRRLDN